MTQEEFDRWQLITQGSRFRWTEDEIFRLNGRGALYYHGDENGIYIKIKNDGSLEAGNYTGAIPHIGEALYEPKAERKYKDFNEAFTAAIKAGGKQFLVDMFSQPVYAEPHAHTAVNKPETITDFGQDIDMNKVNFEHMKNLFAFATDESNDFYNRFFESHLNHFAISANNDTYSEDDYDAGWVAITREIAARYSQMPGTPDNVSEETLFGVAYDLAEHYQQDFQNRIKEQSPLGEQETAILFSRVKLWSDSGEEYEFFMGGFPETYDDIKNYKDFTDHNELVEKLLNGDTDGISAQVTLYCEGESEEEPKPASPKDIERINKAVADVDIDTITGWSQLDELTVDCFIDELPGMSGLE